MQRAKKKSEELWQENLDIATLREHFWRLKKQLKTLIRKKKRQTARDIHNKLESFRTENPRVFWQYIRKVSDKVQDESTKIPLERFADHFRKLNDGPLPGSPVNAIPGHEYNDDEISVEEVKSAINGLKKHKAPGIDTLDPLSTNHLLSL